MEYKAWLEQEIADMKRKFDATNKHDHHNYYYYRGALNALRTAQKNYRAWLEITNK